MSSIRESLEASMEVLAGEDNDDNQEANADQLNMQADDGYESNNSPEDNTGEEVADTTGGEEVVAEEQTAQPDGAQESSSPEQANASDKGEKAPAGWTPANREHWGKLAPELQQQISKREREVNDVLQKSAESRKFQEGFNQVSGKYANVMQREGINDPMQAVNGLFETASVLTSGNPQIKAERIANMIQHYGIDIGTLDDILSGQAPANQPDANDPVAKMLDERLKPMQEMFNNFQTQQQTHTQQQQQNLATEVQQFEQKSEFIADVRNDMADLMTMAAKRGQSMTMEQAYEKACALNPEIAGVLAQRKQQNDLGIKQKASVSLSGKIGGNEQVVAGAGSLRDTLEEAWSGGLE